MITTARSKADANFPGLRGIGFLRLAQTGDEAEVERDILRAHGVPGDLSGDRQPWRARW